MAKLRDKIARIAFGDILSRGIGFLTTVYLARTLGAEAYGLITIALSFLGYQIWFSDLGLLNIGAREIAKEPVKRTFRAKEIYLSKLFFGILVFVAGLLIIPILPVSDLQKSLFKGFSFSLIPYALLLEWYYNGRQHFGKVALSKVTHSLVYLVVIFLFVESTDQLTDIPYMYTAGISASALILGFITIAKHPFDLPTRGWNVFKDLLHSASTIGIGWFFTQSIQLLPPLIIGFALSEREAGLYGAAIRIIFVALIVDRIFVNLLLPSLSSYWADNKARAAESMLTVSRWMISTGAGIALFIAVSSPFIISLIYGDQYAESSEVLSILSVFLFATFVNSIVSYGLVAIGSDRAFFFATMTGGLVTILLLLITSLTDDLLLITLAVVISEWCFVIASNLRFRLHVKLKLTYPVLLCLIIGSGSFYLTTVTSLPVLLEALLAVFLFFILIFATKILTPGHFLWLKEKLNG